MNIPRNKVFNQLFNSDTVKDHVSTNNKDVSIPKQKDVDIPKIKDVNIPQNKVVNISSININQSLVHIKVSCKKLSNQIFNSDTVKDHVSTNNKVVSIPKKGCRHTHKTKFYIYKIKMFTYLPK